MSVTDDLADAIDTLEDVVDETDAWASVLVAGSVAAPRSWSARLATLSLRLDGLATDLQAAA